MVEPAIVFEIPNIQYKCNSKRGTKKCSLLQFLEERSDTGTRYRLCFDKNTNYVFQPGQCIVMESEWKSQNEIRFYELSSHQDWEPTAILKIKGKNPDSYSKWIKGFRQNLKVYSYPITIYTDPTKKERCEFYITSKFLYVMQQNKENRKLKDWYHFIHTDCQMSVDITKIVSGTTRMMIKLKGRSEKVIHFETEHYKEIVAVVKLYSVVAVKDPSNMLTKDDPRYAELTFGKVQEPDTAIQRPIREKVGSDRDIIFQIHPDNQHPIRETVGSDNSTTFQTPVSLSNTFGTQINVAAVSTSDNPSFKSEIISGTSRVDSETRKPILDDQGFNNIRKKKQGEIYVYYMSPTDLNTNMNSNSTLNNSKVIQEKTTSKGESMGCPKKSRYSDTRLQNREKVIEPAYIDFTKLAYEETLLKNLDKMVKELENCKERKLISYDQITVTADLRLSLEINKSSTSDGFRFDEDEEEEFKLSYSAIEELHSTKWALFEINIEYMNELGPSKRFKSKLKIDALQNGRFLNIKVMNVQSNFKGSESQVESSVKPPGKFPLSPIIRQNFAIHLDLPHALHKDWKRFACHADLSQHQIDIIANNNQYPIKTEAVLQHIECDHPENCSKEYLVRLLTDMGRRDLIADYFSPP